FTVSPRCSAGGDAGGGGGVPDAEAQGFTASDPGPSCANAAVVARRRAETSATRKAGGAMRRIRPRGARASQLGGSAARAIAAGAAMRHGVRVHVSSRRFSHVIGFDDAPFDRAFRGDV